MRKHPFPFVCLMVRNSLKRGDIISPVLFNVYMDDLSCALNSSNSGRHNGEEIVNHSIYGMIMMSNLFSQLVMQTIVNCVPKNMQLSIVCYTM